MPISNWDEIRTAFHVARLGTVSGAAEVLGVHHATVIRHIDALEGRLGAKLFQRHARGYTATEAGGDLLQVAQVTNDQFAQLVSRIRGRGAEVTGDLVVTALSDTSPRLTPVLAKFQEQHPGLIVRFLTGEEVLRLEYGEAHVAIRAGSKPEHPDNVVQPFGRVAVTLYASRDYLERHGYPTDAGDIAGHRFVTHENVAVGAPFMRWLAETVPAEARVFRGNDNRTIRDAIAAGVGLGFMSGWEAERHPELIRVLDPLPEWSAPLWLVTHVDLHRTNKVQSFLAFLKSEARDWFET